MSEDDKSRKGRLRAIIAGPVVAAAVALGLTLSNGSGSLRAVDIAGIAAAAALAAVVIVRLVSSRR
ncbi:MAG: hypothetical protein KBA31_14735 [Alphaproteobacteria bacterium]|nr:hypothetical protein [Alphaproteobacteria bacterium]